MLEGVLIIKTNIFEYQSILSRAKYVSCSLLNKVACYVNVISANSKGSQSKPIGTAHKADEYIMSLTSDESCYFSRIK